MVGQTNDDPMLLFDHIGIVVPDIELGRRDLAGMLGPLSWTQSFDDVRLGVSVRFAKDRSNMVYELIAPLGEASPVARALKWRRDLLNQIAYRTKSLELSVSVLRGRGAVPVSAAIPALAFGGAHVQFLMAPLGFLVELIEGERWVHAFS